MIMESTELINPLLVDAVYILSAILALLLIASVAVRGLALARDSMQKKRRDVASRLLFEFLSGEKRLSHIATYIRRYPWFLEDVVDLARELSEDLDGDEREKIEEIFHLPQIYKYYVEKLDSDNVGDIAEAMMFFRVVELLYRDAEEKVFELVKDENSKIAYGAASCLKSSSDRRKIEGLRIVCRRGDISRIAILELLFILAPHIDDLYESAEYVEALLKDEEIDLDTRCVLIRGIGELNHVEYAPFLNDYLMEELNADHPDSMLVGVLLEALGKFYHLDILPIIEELVEDGDHELKVYSAKALGALGEKRSVLMLKKMLNDPSTEVQIEALKHLHKVGPEALNYLTNGQSNGLSRIQRHAMAELTELKEIR